MGLGVSEGPEEDRRVRSSADSKLGKHTVHMVLDSRNRDVQPGRYIPIGQAPFYQAEDLGLPLSEN